MIVTVDDLIKKLVGVSSDLSKTVVIDICDRKYINRQFLVWDVYEEEGKVVMRADQGDWVIEPREELTKATWNSIETEGKP
jgi:hypothetical protein